MKYIDKAIEIIKHEEEEQLRFLSRKDGISTDWSLNGSYRNPGFFTPFNKKMGIKQAAIATGLLPLLKLQNALTATLLIPATLFGSIGIGLHGNWKEAGETALMTLALPISAVYFSGAFILNLLKEVTALITRSFATLVDMCKGTPNGSIESEDKPFVDGMEQHEVNDVEFSEVEEEEDRPPYHSIG